MSTNVGEIDLSLILNSDKFKSQLKNIDGQANTASSKISSSLAKIGKAAIAAFSVTAIAKFGKECVSVASETANAWIGLNSILTGQGKSFQQAKSFINDYVSDGLVPLNNAVAAYKNLALRGYSSDQIKKTMNALKNSATFARQSTYSLGDAVQTATEGLKNENSVVVDNAGVTKNVAKMWEDYAKSIGTTRDKLTQEQKIQAEVNGILEETKFQSNDAAIYANTYSGKIAQLNTAFTNMKTAIGNVIQPLAKLFVPMITAATNAITKLFTSLAGLLSLFGLKADSVETVSNGIGDMATNADKASDAVGSVGDSASKSAKKIKKSLAGWDEINKLDDNSDSSSGSGSGSGGSSGGIKESLDVSSTVQEDTSVFTGLIEKVKELASIFKEGFDAGFGDTNFDGILDHLLNIKNAIVDIWTDPDVLYSAQQWVDTCLYSLGQMTGAVARIGTNIAEFFVGSIDIYLEQYVDRMKTHICNMFDISSEDMALSGNFAQALGELSDVFKSDKAKQIGANIIAMFANPIMSANELCAKFAKDIKGILFQPIIDNVDKLKETFNNVLTPIQTVTGTLADAMTYVGDKWNEVYDNYISPFMESLKTGLSDTFSKFLDVYNEYVVPFMNNIADGLGSLWEEHLRPLVDKIGEFVGSVVTAIQTLWEMWLKPLIDWIIANIIPVLVPIFESIWNTIKNVFGSIADTIGGIIDTFKGLIDFIVGVFTGDWSKAWEGIKTFFTGIWEAIKGFFETIWNALKGIVETYINIVKAQISTVLNAIKTIWENIWNGISGFVTTIWNAIKTAISNAINAIKSAISTVFNNIKNTVSNIFNSIKNTASNIWNTIKNNIVNAVTNIKNGIVNTFQTAYNKITSIFNNIASFFTGVWDRVRNTFSELGTKIGDSMSGAVKAGINGVLRSVENIVNKFIKMINGALDVINAIPGVNISKLNTLNVPKLAQGGYVKANTPQLAMIGDNKTQGEIVAPEDKMLDMILTALKMFKDQDDKPSNGNDDGDIIVNVTVDGEIVQRQIRKRNDRLALATNGRCKI
jgi:phage-related protein